MLISTILVTFYLFSLNSSIASSVILHKCCPTNQFLASVLKCENDFSIDINQYLSEVLKVDLDNFEIVETPIEDLCGDGIKFMSRAVLEGQLSVNTEGGLVLFGDVCPEQFCVANIKGDLIVGVCPIADKEVVLFNYAIILSVFFFTITVIAYCFKKKNLHQTIFLFYILFLLLSYTLVLLINFKLISATYPVVCVIGGYLLQYTFLVSYFWNNIICFNIWRLFRSGLQYTMNDREDRRRVMFYSFYAFGGPLVVCGITGLMHRYLPYESRFNPRIGDEMCFLPAYILDGWPRLIYFYAESGAVMIANLLFFASTAYIIRKLDGEIKKHINKKITFDKYINLFFTMGINWIFEVVSFLAKWWSLKTKVYFYATTFFNCLAGVLVFIWFVLLEQSVKSKLRRLCKCLPPPQEKTTLFSTKETYCDTRS